MSLLRRTRTEMAGAWRSLRYDLGRTPGRPPADGPDMTSTGMGTFGLPGLAADADPAPVARMPRRAVAVTVFGTLTVAGAAGAYLAVVNGLGSLVPGSEAEAGTFPPRAAVTTAVGLGPSSPAGRAPAATVARTVTPGAAPVATSPPPSAAPVPPAAGPLPAQSPIRTTRPAKTECHCNPPVPTPTAPDSSPSPTPSPSPSASASPSPSPSPSPSESGDADHSADPSPSRSWHGKGHRRRH